MGNSWAGGTAPLLQTVLFDLDGTLLPMDTDAFIAAYLEDIAKAVAPVIEPNAFMRHLLAGTEAVLRPSERTETNEATFMAVFLGQGGYDEAVIVPLLEAYYRDRFPKLQRFTQPTPIARAAVQAALTSGCKVAVATNPLFPAVAVEERLRWAGVDDMPWELVTTYENMSSCKPHLAYYEEILHKLGAEPEHVLMVGNDVGEDLVAGQLGIKTYLVEDNIIDRGLSDATPDFRSKLADLPAFFQA